MAALTNNNTGQPGTEGGDLEFKPVDRTGRLLCIVSGILFTAVGATLIILSVLEYNHNIQVNVEGFNGWQIGLLALTAFFAGVSGILVILMLVQKCGKLLDHEKLVTLSLTLGVVHLAMSLGTFLPLMVLQARDRLPLVEAEASFHEWHIGLVTMAAVSLIIFIIVIILSITGKLSQDETHSGSFVKQSSVNTTRVHPDGKRRLEPIGYVGQAPLAEGAVQSETMGKKKKKKSRIKGKFSDVREGHTLKSSVSSIPVSRVDKPRRLPPMPQGMQSNMLPPLSHWALPPENIEKPSGKKSKKKKSKKKKIKRNAVADLGAAPTAQDSLPPVTPQQNGKVPTGIFAVQQTGQNVRAGRFEVDDVMDKMELKQHPSQSHQPPDHSARTFDLNNSNSHVMAVEQQVKEEISTAEQKQQKLIADAPNITKMDGTDAESENKDKTIAGDGVNMHVQASTSGVLTKPEGQSVNKDAMNKHKGQDAMKNRKSQDSMNKHKGQDSMNKHKGQDAVDKHKGQDAVKKRKSQDAMNIHEGQVSMNKHEGLVSMNKHEGQVGIPVPVNAHEGITESVNKNEGQGNINEAQKGHEGQIDKIKSKNLQKENRPGTSVAEENDTEGGQSKLKQLPAIKLGSGSRKLEPIVRGPPRPVLAPGNEDRSKDKEKGSGSNQEGSESQHQESGTKQKGSESKKQGSGSQEQGSELKQQRSESEEQGSESKEQGLESKTQGSEPHQQGSAFPQQIKALPGGSGSNRLKPILPSVFVTQSEDTEPEKETASAQQQVEAGGSVQKAGTAPVDHMTLHDVEETDNLNDTIRSGHSSQRSVRFDTQVYTM